MSGQEPDARPAAAQPDYAGAVYGSLLAASVVVGASALGPYPRLELVLLLLCTGAVFWAAHVYANFVGDRAWQERLTWAEVRHVCSGEWPIVQAAFLPAAVVAISPLLGLGLEGTAWLALGVAVLQQMCWATAEVVQAGAPRRTVVSACVVNLLLGLIIVAAKAALQH
jgi:hypothetical protein